MVPSQRSLFLHRFVRGRGGDTLLIFLCENRRPGPLVFETYFYLVDRNQDCSHYSHGVKNGPTPGVACFT